MGEWISAYDKTPDFGVDVLIMVDGNGISVGSFGGDFWVIGNQFISWDFSYNYEMEVTHWMPLPEPPQS